MRIIAGAYKGRRLATPRGATTRPTADQVRIALLDTLMPWLPGARVLDLFAGAGGVGLEALSRGAAHATLVERDARAVAALRANVATLGVEKAARVVRDEVARALSALARAGERFDVVFLDPPRFGAEARLAKLRLLARLSTVRIARAKTLERLHETLCFVRAYPDDAAVQDAAERALREFTLRVRRLAPPARAGLHDSGIAETAVAYPFGLPMARWLATRLPGDVKIAWRTFHGGERPEDAPSLVV